MEITEARRIARIQQWSEMVQARVASGQTVKAWCKTIGVSTKTYYYRLRQVRRETLSSAASETQMLPSQTKCFPAFVELALPGNGLVEGHSKDAARTAVTITVGSMTISIHNEAEPGIIMGVIKAASEVAAGGLPR